MKAKNHLKIHTLILIFFFILTYIIIKDSLLKIIYDFRFIIGIGLYFLGAILPDSDSNNKGSYIYSKFKNEPLYYMAYVVSWVEYPLSKYFTKRKIGHRESLHTVIGIFFTSILIVFIISILYLIIYKSLPILWILLWIIILFISQYFHLLEDVNKTKYPDWKIKLSK